MIFDNHLILKTILRIFKNVEKAYSTGGWVALQDKSTNNLPYIMIDKNNDITYQTLSEFEEKGYLKFDSGIEYLYLIGCLELNSNKIEILHLLEEFYIYLENIMNTKATIEKSKILYHYYDKLVELNSPLLPNLDGNYSIWRRDIDGSWIEPYGGNENE